MKITIETIPHKNQRYPTVGDWQFDGKDLHIFVSEMRDARYEWLIGRHELDEALLCIFNGVTQKQVDDYDHSHPTAGNDCFSHHEDSPYYFEHNSALSFEWQFAQMLKVDWRAYTADVEELFGGTNETT